MAVSAWQAVLAVQLFVCLASFAWGMRNFFAQPAGTTAGMKVVSTCGVSFAALHFFAILVTSSITPERGLLGALLYSWSLVLFWWAIKTNSSARLSAAFSPDLPVHLVKDGPYRFIRHPFYCSYVLAWLSGTMLIIYWKAASIEEEKFSRSSLAAEYQTYRSRTSWLVPNPMKLLPARRSQ
jgi:protein-S-isoprenylcysteine O-methyltransferase Ste14